MRRSIKAIAFILAPLAAGAGQTAAAQSDSILKSREYGAERARQAAAQCSAGDADACQKLSGWHFFGNGIPVDRRKSAEYTIKACEAGLASSCETAGNELSGQGPAAGVAPVLPRDPAKAARYYDMACEAGRRTSCELLTNGYVSGSLAPRDIAAAARYADKACNLDSAGACMWLAKAAYTGQGVAADRSRALQLSVKACRLGEADGCLGEALIHDEGVLGTRDIAKAAEAYRKALKINPSHQAAAAGLTALGQ